MARPKKECKPISIRMEQSVFERLCSFCDTVGQTKTVAIERAIAMYIDVYDQQQAVLASEKNK